MQTRRGSLIEVCVNTGTGFVVAYAAGLIVYPMFGLDVGGATNLALVAIFTLISVIRSYAVRRCFNWLHVRWL